MSIINSGQNFSPYSTTVQTAAPSLGMDVTSQIKKYQQEELLQKAPKELPFTLDTSMEYIDRAYMSLLNLKKDLIKTGEEPEANKKAVEAAHEVVDSIIENLLITLPEKLDKLYL